jgi:hypothetical protein
VKAERGSGVAARAKSFDDGAAMPAAAVDSSANAMVDFMLSI